MVKLNTTDNRLVAIAVGYENGRWYVQTIDLNEDMYLSEEIQEDLNSKEHALAIAQLYIDEYNFELYEEGN